MRRILLFLLVLIPAFGAGSQLAFAEPVDVSVRIEGVNQTVFDRVVHTDGREIQSASDDTPRPCDGTNLGANPEPGPTPTAASVDAMEIIGETFDGNWYDGYEDYFLTRWGGEAEDNANGWWWGILVNEDFTPVGGCQARIQGGDRVLWINDAFSGRPMLKLEGPATVTVGEPVEVEVSSDQADRFEGAIVGGINAASQEYPADVVVPGESDADGVATVQFNQPGWKRLKARAPGTGGVDAAVASNSIDVCVERNPGTGCTGQPPSQIPAVVGHEPAVEIPEPEPTCETDPSLCPEPEPTCETDASLCPVPDPTCETDSKLCPVSKGPRLKLRKLKAKPARVRVGRKATLSARVVNTGNGAARNVKVCVATGARLRAGGCRKVKRLGAGTARTVKFKIKARRKAKQGRARIKVRWSANGVSAKSRTVKLKVIKRRGR